MTDVQREALLKAELLDSPQEAAFDRLTRLVCLLLDAPVSLVSILDDDRQFFKSARGLREPWASQRESPLSHSFCQHVVASNEALIVPDARDDPRLCSNLAIQEMNVVAYLGIPLRMPNGLVIGSLCAIDSVPRMWNSEDIQNITDLAAVAMSELAARYHERTGSEFAQTIRLQTHLLNAVEQAVIATDVEGTILFWNRFAESLYGWPAEEVLGRPVDEVTPAPEMAEHAQQIMTCLQKGESWSGEFKVKRRDGTSFPAYVLDSPIQDEEGNLIGVVGVSFDVSERQEAENSLRESEQLLRKLIDSLFTFVGLLTPDGILIEANRTALQAANLRAEDVSNRPFEETYWWSYSKDVQDQLRASIKRCAEGEALRYDVDVRLADDRFITIDFMLAPIVNEEGEVTHLIPSGLDITDRKRMEDEIRANADELKRLAADLEQRVAQRTQALQRSNRELQEFAYVASHDLQEPLRKIITFASRLRSRFHDDLDATALDYMDRMQNAAERMKVLINDLLTLSRVTTRGEPFKPVDLKQVASNVAQDLETTIDSANGTIEIEDLPTVEADSSQISRLLQNLIVNSLKFSRAEAPPVVKISASELHENVNGETYVQIAVADNGIGFDEKYLDRIFQPFQRLHGRNTYEGTGMGLAICQRIVERHGGTISAQSTPGEGTTFFITLPHVQSEHKEQR